jgi:hypothetical protein
MYTIQGFGYHRGVAYTAGTIVGHFAMYDRIYGSATAVE